MRKRVVQAELSLTHTRARARTHTRAHTHIPAGTPHTPFSLAPFWQSPSKVSVIAAKIGDGTSSTLVPESRMADLRATFGAEAEWGSE